MKKIIRVLCLSALLCLPFGLSANAVVLTPPAAPEKPATAMQVIDNVIGQQLQALVTNPNGTEIEPQETFGTKAFGIGLSLIEAMRDDGLSVLEGFTALPQAGAWFAQQYNDASLNARWKSIGQLLLYALISAFALGLALQLALTRPRHHLSRRIYSSTGSKVAGAFGWLGLSLIPVVFFTGLALVLMNESDPPRLSRFVAMNVLYALVLSRLINLLAKFLLAPKRARLRLFALSDDYAVYLQRWIDRLSLVMIYGFFCVDVARLVRVPTTAINALSSLIGFVITTMTVTMIFQKRQAVASFLRGDLSPRSPDLTSWQSVRIWLSRVWHKLAIAYLVIGYMVTMLRVGNGFSSLLQGTLLTLCILIVMRLLFHAITSVGADATSHFYRPVLRALLRLVVWIGALLSIAASWGIDIIALVETPWGQRLSGSTLSIASTILVATLVYETLNGAVEKRLHPRDSHGKQIIPSSRTLTLLPLLRNTALVVLTGIVIVMTLSELGVNIAPLLAGAGVIGVAIGFGSQSLVKDFITGLFILMEDAIAIGDIVAIGDFSGVVESMTIRTLRLRAVNGDLHILPFGEVAKLTNMSKGFSYALIDIGVAYNSDLRKVMSVLTEVAENLRTNPDFANMVLAPLEMFGVDKLADFAIQVQCRLKTQPGKQFLVRRAFLLHAKERFDQEGIEIPFPTVTQIAHAVPGD